ncbi:MAG: signal peptidase I, partial [Planctomycetales bacterium]|nr:signal peptidase I [Planctomycetales bacterium]
LGFRLFVPTTSAQAILSGIVELAVTVLTPCLIIMKAFRTRFFRAVQAWLPTLLPSLATALLIFLVLIPFICETLVVRANPMAPTLLGEHWRGKCRECGHPSFCSPEDARYRRPETSGMICENFHVNEGADVSQRILGPDRILVAKFFRPERWNLVVFRHPNDSSTLDVKRLVGLPGETIHIEGGKVWANGRQLEPPEHLDGIEYLSESSGWFDGTWGSPDRPAVLGADEYFVLGDFSLRSNDSRTWEEGAVGHNPFAVPQSHMRGVVTHIYWPPQRWRILR